MNRKIVVIGGGVSGLSAASALVRSGYSVVLLEAKDRFGGRIHTVHDGPLPIELGAEFLHGENQTLSNVINAAGLSIHDVSDNYRWWKNGEFKTVNVWDRMNRLIHRVDSGARDLTFLEFLDAQRLDGNDRMQALSFVQGFHAAHPDRISAHSLLRGEYAAERMQNTRQGRINEGYSALVGFLVEDIRAHGGNLFLNAQVTNVRWQPGGVNVTCAPGSVGTIKADAAVITLPLGVLKAGVVKFEPSLTRKLESIDQLQFGNVVKVIHLFREQWWPDFGFILAPDEAVPTWWTDPRGPVLTGWAGGPVADTLVDQSPAQIEALSLSILQRIFPSEAAKIRGAHAGSHVYNWAADPHVRGAYSYVPVNGLDLPKLLGAPVADTLFFAGEATVTDAQTGTVFGACETGLRAAQELMNCEAHSALVEDSRSYA